jgi:hypothetical protein
LASLADEDHARFTRDDGRPEYRERRLAVVLAQGAALHFVNGTNGVKDLDVWTFYAAIPGIRFPADRRETHADFGRSDLGRQLDSELARRRRRVHRQTQTHAMALGAEGAHPPGTRRPYR